MAKLTKKQKALQGKVDSNKLYPLTDALSIVKECATAKFDESIDVAVQLGIDAKKSDQVVRGADRKSTRLNSSHIPLSRMPSSA